MQLNTYGVQESPRSPSKELSGPKCQRAALEKPWPRVNAALEAAPSSDTEREEAGKNRKSS